MHCSDEELAIDFTYNMKKLLQGQTTGLSYWPMTRPDQAKIADPLIRDLWPGDPVPSLGQIPKPAKIEREYAFSSQTHSLKTCNLHIINLFTRYNRLSNRFDNRFPVWQSVWQPCWMNSHCSSNRLSNRVVQPIWQPAVYTIQPVVIPVVKRVWQPVWQQVLSCKRGLSKLLRRFQQILHNDKYHQVFFVAVRTRA